MYNDKNKSPAPINNIPLNYKNTTQRMADICQQAPLAKHKPQLIAVSKQQPGERIDALLQSGHRLFGENRLQEAYNRWQARKLRYTNLQLHFLGRVQTNKAADIVCLFDYIHSIDRPKLAIAISKEMRKQNRTPQCFIQVNTGEEPQKSGIMPADLHDFIQLCKYELKLPIIGLMCLPPRNCNPVPHFAFLRKMAQQYSLTQLSMGMSNDWQYALRMGATHIRLGTAIFGPRQSKQTETNGI